MCPKSGENEGKRTRKGVIEGEFSYTFYHFLYTLKPLIDLGFMEFNMYK